MSKKTIFTLLTLLSFLTVIQGVTGAAPTYIHGWIGKYLEIWHFEVDPSEVRVNDTIDLQFELLVRRDMFIEVVEVRITTRADLDTIYNKTLVKNSHIELPANALGKTILETDELTATQEGILSFHMHAKYQYNEGNQTLEQEGTIFISNMARVRELTYHDLSLERDSLTSEVTNLNTTSEALRASHSELKNLTYFLGITSCVFIATTFYFAIRRKVKPEIKTI